MFPEVLLPINNGFTAIQKSIVECAHAGCNTIWVVANPDLSPIVRKRVGDWIYDPVYLGRSRYGEGSEYRREIPIYYASILPKNIDRRDSYGWSVLSGIYASWLTANKISKWMVPEKYYISFPMGIFDIYEIRKHRQIISDPDKNFFLTHNNKSVKEGLPLSFTMFNEDYLNCRRDINKKTTKEYYNTIEGEQYPSRKLPLEKRWSAKHFSFEEVFEKLSTKNANICELEVFHNVASWEGYQAYMASTFILKTPGKMLTDVHTHVNIPYIL